MGAYGIHISMDVIISVVTEHISTKGLHFIGLTSFGYLLSIPLTAFLAKRSLFIDGGSNNIYFPGGQEGRGSYLTEKEILGSVGLRAREAPIDFWILGFVTFPTMILTVLISDYWMPEITIPFSDSTSGGIPPEMAREIMQKSRTGAMIGAIVGAVLFAALFLIAAIRRAKTGRS